MFELYNNVNAGAFSNSEPVTLYTAARIAFGYRELLNMEPAPFDFVPRREPGALKRLFQRSRAPHSAVRHG